MRIVAVVVMKKWWEDLVRFNCREQSSGDRDW